MRRLAERTPELTAEMCGRELRSPRERPDVERIAITRVDEISRPKQVPRRMRCLHRPSMARRMLAVYASRS
jgi:hypothetical protein